MPTHDFVTLYDMRAIEYLIAVAYLALFAGFWRALEPAASPALARVAVRKPEPTGWFTLPDDVKLHPGHSWARVLPDGLVAIGLDDFGHKLVGSPERTWLPEAGATLEQGRPAFGLTAAGREVPVLSPVDGVVAEVNSEAAAHAADLHLDPYGSGWLLKVRPHGKLVSNLKQLLSGDSARLLMERSASTLRSRLTPELGALAADGGQPIHGFAREIDPEHWDALAREFLLTADPADAMTPAAAPEVTRA